MQDYPEVFPPQRQDQHPGVEADMNPKPVYIREGYKGSDKLKDKVAIITGGDSGIGRSVAVHFAEEGADVAIVFTKHEQIDADKTKEEVEARGRKCLLFDGDQSEKSFCTDVVEKVVDHFGKLDILVNNAAFQQPDDKIEDIPEEKIKRTFEVNVYGYFFFTQAALKHMKEGATIVNTSSINAFRGNELLIDYSTTKGANLAFSRSIALKLVDRGIRVNTVAPGPIWTPFIVSGMPKEMVAVFGKQTNMGRAGQPAELGPAYVYLASEDSSYVTGQTIHVNGGSIVGA
jgi:NAD(P)-dependent dehydrogenase (short-subunit alcohol dehydrogenase family)